VVDDGAGIDLLLSGSGLGLVGMRERLAALGGSLTVTTEAGHGTTLDVLIPVAGRLA
jgi:signal transduction histidine kinase